MSRCRLLRAVPSKLAGLATLGGFDRNDRELRDRLNETLLHWQTTGKTEDVLDRWIPVRKITVDAKPAT